MTKNLATMLGIKYPIIMAPMFLVSNSTMVIEALNNGISAAIPALNFRTDEALRSCINEIKANSDKPFGINLIVNKSNAKYKEQLKTIIELKVDYIITSLGNPKKAIEQCKVHGIKVFCDVTDLKYAKKVEAIGADAIIAVNNEAGGHSGNLSAQELIATLKKHCNIPIISAGGIANNNDYNSILNIGADGVSIGTPFIASNECNVSNEYKEAIIKYSTSDIVMTNKMSGSPLSVINTDYVKEINKKTTFLESILHKNRTLKKFIKMIILFRGQKTMEKSAFKATYKTVWVAGPSIGRIHKIRSVKQIIDSLVLPK